MSHPHATTHTPALAVQALGLSKSYGTQWALRGVSLEVHAGEAVALFGANGAGKSTLIRILATLVAPSHGSLEISGYDAARNPRIVRAALGIVGHQTYLYSELTAAENLGVYADLYGLDSAEGRVREALASVGLTAASGKRVRELSRGMQQRLALARATLHAPALLLLDEPDSSLDADGVRCLERLLAHARERGQAVVLATHRIEFGLALCDHVLILSRGRVAHFAPVATNSVERWRALYNEGSLRDRER